MTPIIDCCWVGAVPKLNSNNLAGPSGKTKDLRQAFSQASSATESPQLTTTISLQDFLWFWTALCRAPALLQLCTTALHEIMAIESLQTVNKFNHSTWYLDLASTLSDTLNTHQLGTIYPYSRGARKVLVDCLLGIQMRQSARHTYEIS